MSSNRSCWIMHQFFKGCYLFRLPSEGQELWGLFNPNGRPVEANPIENDLLERLLAAGWIERQGEDNMVASQKGLCALACGANLPSHEAPAVVWAGSCKIIPIG